MNEQICFQERPFQRFKVSCIESFKWTAAMLWHIREQSRYLTYAGQRNLRIKSLNKANT